MSAHRFHFRTRWLGYDRAEVDRLLDQVAGDRQILKDQLNYLESIVARHSDTDQGRAGAWRLTEASVRASIDAQQVQLARLKNLTREVTTCLDACGATL